MTLPTLAYLRECFELDAKAGTLTWRVRPREHFPTERGWKISNGRNAGKIAGSPNDEGYLRVAIDQKQYRLHRIVYAMAHSIELSSVPEQVDHRDVDTFNNGIDNLRPATGSQNTANQRKKPNCTSIYKGVAWRKDRQRWRAQIRIDGKQTCLGLFPPTKEGELAAAAAYERAAEVYHGEFARVA